ncbi:GDSL-type esterase/lipase family protein [Mastigocoleus testarum]|uniref:G-D-S-L family lipolytic protein n=1 Tax=Mastigocoleus testarum BC008 TaxID=371196 RepID=A0A0V7ZB58_9CYAN|nr:GDSL-type esterase/lipase family protein [Mastigocoleus testarum]KST61764.1 G-D-S-L family lipolytic protein [Mastigocoleus testarum BC008]
MQLLQTSSSMQLSLNKKRVQPLKIVALGDSLVYGFGDTEGGGWVERLRRSWMQPSSPGHVIYNLGVRGDRIGQVAKRLEVEFRHRGELRNRVPDMIILSVGVNDSARVGRPNGKNYTNFAVFETEIASLLKQASLLCPVLFIGMVPVDETKMPFMDCLYYNHSDQYRYKEATRLACVKKGIPYLDIFQKWIGLSEEWRAKRLSADGLHPNVTGYRELLEEVINWSAIAKHNHNSHHVTNFREL